MSEITFYGLSEDSLEFLQNARDAILAFLDDNDKRAFEKPQTKLDIAHDIYESNEWKENEDLLDIIAVFLGDALCKRVGLEWTIIEDEDGTDLVIKDPARLIFASPFSEIGERVGQEKLDIYELFGDIEKSIEEMRKTGKSSCSDESS